MATATKKHSGAVKFLVFEDNGGEYRWTVLGSGGESLAQSGTFSTYDDAEQASRVVRDGRSSAGGAVA